MKYFLFTIGVAVAMFATRAYAAEVTVTVAPSLTTGSQITVPVLLDPQHTSINSLDIAVSFPQSLLRFDGYTNAIVPLWITPPHETEKGVISFSGIIPGGVNREYDPQLPDNTLIPIVQLQFTVVSPGSGQFAIAHASLLQNDGQGTTVATTTTPQSFVASGTPYSGTDQKSDTTPPNVFTITILPSSLFGETPRLAMFESADAQSGIDHYEVRLGHGAWREAASPYPLPPHLFPYTLFVRAYDFSGNYQQQYVTVPGKLFPSLFYIGAVLLVVLGILRMRLRSKKSL